MSERYQRVKAPGSLDFALHTLGWRNFQDLCGAILDKVLGQSLTVFADSNDAGRDGAFFGSWQSEGIDETFTGKIDGATVMQCKFTVKANSTLSLSDISDELKKIKKLFDKDLCDNYILITNARVTGKAEEAIREAVVAEGPKNVYILDGNWICRKILANQKLRLFVPRVYGLGDLGQILDARAYEQAEALLDQLEGLSTFVVTNSYKKAAKAIEDNSFVLLLGEPASGKSVIAASLAMAALDRWKTPVVKVASAKDFTDHWNPNEPGQFFWIDDAFGAVRHEQVLTDEWSRALPTLMTAIKNGSKVVMTSRDYIYREAKPLLKDYAYPKLREGQVVIKVSQLSIDEKQKILYNHIKLGDQPPVFKQHIKRHLASVSTLDGFLPEVARRLGTRLFTAGIDPSIHQDVVDFVKNPNDYLQDIFSGLDSNQRAVLALVYKSTNLNSPVRLTDAQREVIERFGGEPSKVNESLNFLKDTFLRYSKTIDSEENAPYWTFHHPTLREGYARFIMSNDDLIDVFIDGLSLKEALEQLDCGTSKTRGQLIKVPASSYDHVIEKLSSYTQYQKKLIAYDRYQNATRMHAFLTRSSATFLRKFLKKNPTFIKDNLMNFGRFIIYQSSLHTLNHLAKLRLLPEDLRLEVVSFFERAGVDTPDSTWLHADYSSLITEEEKHELLGLVTKKLIPNLDQVIDDWESDADAADSSYYTPLEETITEYQSALSLFTDASIDREDMYEKLEEAYDRVVILGEEHAVKVSEADANESLYEDDHVPSSYQAPRSIFDDIDQ